MKLLFFKKKKGNNKKKPTHQKEKQNKTPKTPIVWDSDWVFNKVRMVINPYSYFEENFKINSL